MKTRPRAVRRPLRGLFRSADPRQNRGEGVTVRQILTVGASQLLTPGERSPRWAPMPVGGLSFDPGTRADLLHAIADVNFNLGSYDDAQKLLVSALALREGLTGRADQLGKAASHTLLGHVALERGHYTESLRHYARAIAIKKQQLGPRDPSLAEDLNGLGSAWTELDDPAKATEYLKEGEAIARQAGSGTTL